MTAYTFPKTVNEAVRLLENEQGAARVIAGGTDLLLEMRKKKHSPKLLIDITRIAGIDRIDVSDRVVTVGAAVSFNDIANHAYIRTHIPALVEAVSTVGSASIRTCATWAGNIVQAMPAADGAIAAIALEAEAQIVDPNGAVWRPVEALFDGPGVSAVNPTRQVITQIRFHVPPGPWGMGWSRLGRRESLVLPILNCAAKLRLRDHDDTIENAVIALGPVASHPFRAADAASYLKGKKPTQDVFLQAGKIARDESNPRSSVARASREYRLAVIPITVQEALISAANRAAGQPKTGD